MYICLECGHVFDEPTTWSESRPYGEGYAYEGFSGCPCCQGGYEEAFECEFCGEYFSKDDLDNGCCEKCKEDVKQRIAKAIFNEFTYNEYEALPEDYLEDVYEAVYEIFKRDGQEEGVK